MSVGPALNVHSSINCCAPFGVNLYACAPGKYGLETNEPYPIKDGVLNFPYDGLP